MNLTNYTPKGELINFPKEIIKKMFEYQIDQTGKKNESIFENEKNSCRKDGGFTWELTEEGNSFWYKVIFNNKFNLFFEKYPEKIKEEIKWFL